MLKWDLEMQSTLLLLLGFFFYLLFPPLCTWKKNNLDCEKTLKIQPQGQTPAGHTCQSKLSQHNSLKDDFLFADDISDRTITHLSPGCAKNYQQDICQCIWDMVALILVKMRHTEKGKDKTKREKELGLLNLIFRQTPLSEPFL